jgi:hypothetical protein
VQHDGRGSNNIFGRSHVIILELRNTVFIKRKRERSIIGLLSLALGRLLDFQSMRDCHERRAGS